MRGVFRLLLDTLAVFALTIAGAVVSAAAAGPSITAVVPSSGTTGSSVNLAVTGTSFDASATLSLERWDIVHGTWAATASMSVARSGVQAAALLDGRALVVGGYDASYTSRSSAEVYDPGTGTWTSVPAMAVARESLDMITLSDGRVLVAGGRQMTNNSAQQDTAVAQLFDPVSDTWTTVASLPQALDSALGALLPDGRAILVGGYSTGLGSPLATVEIFNPSSGTWTAGASMSTPRSAAAMTQLKDGRLLVSGGVDATGTTVATAEIYDPVHDSWSAAGSMTTPRYSHALATLPDGRVLATGGTPGTATILSSAEIYNPATNAWTATAGMGSARQYPGAYVIGGKAYLFGGDTGSGATTATEAYDPASGSWTAGRPMTTGRVWAAYAELADGRVLAAGGQPGGYPATAVSSAELLTMPAIAVSGTGVSAADATHLSGTVNLAGAATGYWDVEIGESGGRVGRLPGGFKIVLGAPSFSGVAVGTGSVDWSWGLVAGAVGSEVLDATGTARSGSLAAPATSWLETGLTPNAPTTRRVTQFDADASSTSSGLATVYTLADPPAGAAASAVFVSSLTLSWSANGNPSGTLSFVERSTDAASFAQVFAASAAAFGDSGLAACTTYYYRVRDRNGDGVYTAYAAAAPALTAAAAPLPPSGLSAQSLLGGRVALSWSASPSTYVDSYRIFVGTAAVDYSSPYAVVPASATAWTGLAPSTGTTYRFGLRAYAGCAGDDGNTTLVASVVPVSTMSPAALAAAIKVPETGKKVSGNRVTVMAEIVSGDPATARDVRFQYRTAASTTAPWSDVPAADAQHPNPSPSAPYFIHWDVTSVPNGDYELRAVATALDGTSDPVSATIVIAVDAATPDSVENAVGGSDQKAETVYSGAGRTVSLGDGGSDTVMAVTIPGSCVNASTDTLTVTANPAAAPPASPGTVSANQHIQISLGSGQTKLGAPATITFHYSDAKSAGILDGTNLPVADLAIFTYDPAGGVWRQEARSVIDTTAKTISATTPHFSLFGLFSAAASDLSSVRVYPVPWVPNDADPDNGRAYSASDPDSGVVFAGLTASVRVQIFTVSGQLVWETDTDASNGRVQWDGRNRAGRDAASGGYVAVITDRTTGAKIVRKIAIIR